MRFTHASWLPRAAFVEALDRLVGERGRMIHGDVYARVRAG